MKDKKKEQFSSLAEKREKKAREHRNKMVLLGIIGVMSIAPLYMLGNGLYNHFKPKEPTQQVESKPQIADAMLNRYVESTQQSTSSTVQESTTQQSSINHEARANALEQELGALRQQQSSMQEEASRHKERYEAIMLENEKINTENTTLRRERELLLTENQRLRATRQTVTDEQPTQPSLRDGLNNAVTTTTRTTSGE